MMLRTHLAIAVFFILLFLPLVSNKILFAIVALIATYIPDIDNGFSTAGRMHGAWIIQAFSKHRGFFHSFTFCIIVAIILAAIFPPIALPFFLGYSIHLFSDSFTKEGIRPIWPLQKKSNWYFRTGGFTETGFFIAMLLVDLITFVVVYKNIF